MDMPTSDSVPCRMGAESVPLLDAGIGSFLRLLMSADWERESWSNPTQIRSADLHSGRVVRDPDHQALGTACGLKYSAEVGVLSKRPDVQFSPTLSINFHLGKSKLPQPDSRLLLRVSCMPEFLGRMKLKLVTDHACF